MGAGYLTWGDTNDDVFLPVTAAPTKLVKPTQIPVGSRENPLLIGTEVSIGDWSVAVGPQRIGTESIAEYWADYFRPPQEGFEYYFIPVTATYQGEETGTAWKELEIKFVGDDARTYGGDCPSYPGRNGKGKSFGSGEDLGKGGVADGIRCIELPQDARGLWTISATSRLSEKVFFNAQ